MAIVCSPWQAGFLTNHDDLFPGATGSYTRSVTSMVEHSARRPDSHSCPNSAAFAYYPRLSAVAEYVGAHLTDHISLAAASEVAGLERKYFSVYFRSKVGISFSEWLRFLRVTRAKNLME